ncbi:MAG: hypothetical protein J6W75_13940 [Bacteroidaceae bacterium]|nr:hypothetical protein [Bacteroidaceae bacterium]
MSNKKVNQINEALKAYYEQHPNDSKRPAKDFMEYFVKNGIFNKDTEERSGLPLRKILRELDEHNECDAIPYLVVDRKLKNRRWFFAPIK